MLQHTAAHNFLKSVILKTLLGRRISWRHTNIYVLFILQDKYGAPIRRKIDLKTSPRTRFNDDHATIFRKNNTTTGMHCVQRITFGFWPILRRCIMCLFCLFCIYILYCTYIYKSSLKVLFHIRMLSIVLFVRRYNMRNFQKLFFSSFREIANFSFKEGLSYLIRHVTQCF